MGSDRSAGVSAGLVMFDDGGGGNGWRGREVLGVMGGQVMGGMMESEDGVMKRWALMTTGWWLAHCRESVGRLLRR